jgi:dolichol kinase
MLLLLLFCASSVILFQVLITYYRKDITSSRSHLHMSRRLQHIGTGLIIAVLYYNIDQSLAPILALIPTVSVIILDYLRRNYSPNLNAWLLNHFSSIMRPDELYSRTPGGVYFLIGITFILMCNDDRGIIYISIFNQTLCDPIASICGILIGGPKISEGKTWSGSISGGIVGAIIVLFYNLVNNADLSIALGAVIAFASEVVSVPGLDDNVTIPVITTALYRLTFLIK